MALGRERNHLIWQQVRDEDDLRKALQLTADISEQITNETLVEFEKLSAKLAEQQASINTSINELRKLLTGNGNPSHSIVARLDRIEESQGKFMDGFNKVIWLIVSVALTQVVLLILRLI